MFAVLLVSVAQPPPPTIALPAEVRAAPGRLIKLTAETTGKQVRWALAAADADLIPFPDGKLAVFAAAKPGRYLVLAWTAFGDVPSDAARCVVVVGETTPPADPFADDLRKLFAADATPDKSAHAAQLAALYREAIAFAARADVTTAGDLAARIRAAAASLVPAGALVGVRKRVADEIAKVLPADGDAALDAATRAAAGALFTKIAAALEGLK